jgi:uncharacterized protein (TIGR02145 family)
MKRCFNISKIIFIVLSIFLIHSCKKEKVPTLTTATVTNITGTTATGGGTITDEGSGTVIARGVCWSTGITPTIADSKTADGAGSGTFTSNISDLNGSTTYFVRTYATNKVGTGYGMAVSFVTLGQVPNAITQSATNVTTTSATLNGIINANYLSTTVTFEYGTSISYGHTVISEQNEVTGNNFINVSADIYDLMPATVYHFRVIPRNSLGTVFGIDLTFTTSSGNVSDVEGNVYNTVTIGTQFWMAENLKTTRYRNGDLIGTTSPATLALNISDGTTPKYQWAYDGNESNVPTYGRLYTWYTVTDSRNVCPIGWHVPGDEEWTNLALYLTVFGELPREAGGKLKEAGTVHWNSPNAGATNETGFTALPGGTRAYTGSFDHIGNMGFWWSVSTQENNPIMAWLRFLWSDYRTLESEFEWKAFGCSVRCVKD